jgi:hypothetical protein
LLAAAEAAGVSHMVAQSFAQSFKGGRVLTEGDPPYLGTGAMMRRLAEAVVHVEDAVVKAGGAALRYGAFYGPGATHDQVEAARNDWRAQRVTHVALQIWLDRLDPVLALPACARDVKG